MARPITLFTIQWGDLSLEEVCRLAKEMGFEGLELSAAHLDMKRAATDPAYVAEVTKLYDAQCALLAGLDNGFNFLFGEDETKIIYRLPYNPLKDPALYEAGLRDDDGVQFSHSIEEQIGGQLAAGFKLTGIYEDTNGSGFLHEHGAPCFYATRAVRE